MRRIRTLCVGIILCLLFLASPAILSGTPFSPSTAHAQLGPLGDLAGNWAEEAIAGGFSAVLDGATNSEGFVIRIMNIGAQYTAKAVGGHIPGLTIAANADPEILRQSARTSAVGALAQSIVPMYQIPPASTYAFVQDAGISLGLIPKPVYAQGIGFAGLSSLLPLWKAFRNIAYFVMAIVMVVIGFMVMFRKKIDPRTVVTVQNALPKIVITLILITFSYAIVGIVVDAMYLLNLVIIGIFKNTGFLSSSADLARDFTSGNFFTTVGRIAPLGAEAGFHAVGGGGIVASMGAGGIIGLIIGGILAALGTGGTAAVGGLIGLFLVFILFGFVLLFALFRIFFMLLMAYVNIIIALIFGPIQIMFDAVPGGNGFSGWIRNLVANMLVFPATVLTFTLATCMIEIARQSTTSNLWAPPFLTFPVVGSPGAGVPGILALGLLLITPTLGNALKDALKPPEFKYAGAPAAAIGAVFGFPVSFGMGMAQTALTHRMMRQGGPHQPSQPSATAPPSGKK